MGPALTGIMEEARAILDRAEEAELVHMSRNTTEDIEFPCNFDRWHCEVVKQVLGHPKPGLIFHSPSPGCPVRPSSVAVLLRRVEKHGEDR
ncbi:MAG: hypothetical protein KKE57_09475, partial [Proteobacteria bacterium]|nr:hypothetical protein [Pseudomonadota bacterium]